MAVPLLDLKPQYQTMKEEILAEIAAVCESQQFIGGPKIEKLEKEIAEYCQAGYGCGVTSGSDALIIALMVSGIGAGDEVITTPFTFFATVGAIARVGATPVFADIDPVTFNIDPAKIEEKITPTATILTCFTLNCLMSETIRLIKAKGGSPDIWLSNNIPGCDEHNKPIHDKYRKRIHHLYPVW